MLWTYLGFALMALVAGQLVVSLLATIRRSRLAAQRRTLEIARFAEELAMVREARRMQVQDSAPWNGFRQFVVRRKVEESPSVRSFYLEPHDAKPLPAFKPGQYLTFRLPGQHRDGQLIRCYSLSDHPRQPYYRVTIKRVPAPPGSEAVIGLGSGLFHDQIKENDVLDLRAPSGNFFLDPQDQTPVVLVGCGIGLTPVYSMLATLVNLQSRRPVSFYYGVRNRSEHLFKKELEAIAREQPHVRIRICYSQPRPDDRLGEDYHVAGRVSVDLLRQELPSNNHHFYYCGPGAMMESLANGLKEWGVPDARLHYEAFGPLSVKQVNHAIVRAPAPANAKQHYVTFRKSGTALPWDASRGTLLDLAELAGIAIASGCRTGNCGTCVVAVQEGEVTYLQPPGTTPEARTCLACIAQPKGDLVLDA
jgi:ferredoxin-NADP reductase